MEKSRRLSHATGTAKGSGSWLGDVRLKYFNLLTGFPNAL